MVSYMSRKQFMWKNGSYEQYSLLQITQFREFIQRHFKNPIQRGSGSSHIHIEWPKWFVENEQAISNRQAWLKSVWSHEGWSIPLVWWGGHRWSIMSCGEGTRWSIRRGGRITWKAWCRLSTERTRGTKAQPIRWRAQQDHKSVG